MRFGPTARDEVDVGPLGQRRVAPQRAAPKRSIAKLPRSPRTKTTRCGTPTFIGIAVGGSPRPEIGIGSRGAGDGRQRERHAARRRRAPRSAPSRSRARATSSRDEAVPDGVARGAARAVGAEGRGAAVGVEIVERARGPFSPGERKSAPSAPTERPRRHTSARRRRSSSVRSRPSASKTRKSLPPPAILTKRVGKGHGSGSVNDAAQSSRETEAVRQKRLGDGLGQRAALGLPARSTGATV